VFKTLTWTARGPHTATYHHHTSYTTEEVLQRVGWRRLHCKLIIMWSVSVWNDQTVTQCSFDKQLLQQQLNKITTIQLCMNSSSTLKSILPSLYLFLFRFFWHGYRGRIKVLDSIWGNFWLITAVRKLVRRLSMGVCVCILLRGDNYLEFFKQGNKLEM